MLKLFAFEGAETDWVAARTLEEARETLKTHYGIDDDDIDSSYHEIGEELHPDAVKVVTDEVDAETEEAITKTAAEAMAGKTKPFLVASTYM